MTASELEEWAEFFSTEPEIQEMQMARLMQMFFAANFKGDRTVEDFLVTRPPRPASAIDAMSVDQINELLGVA